MAGEHSELGAAARRESFGPPDAGLQGLKAMGLQTENINTAHIKEHEIVLCAVQVNFYSISNITCSLGV